MQLLDLKCVQLSPNDYFSYASGLKGPIYCDNRKGLSHPKERSNLIKALKEWSPMFKNVVVACGPGNHGENRKNGKAYTTFGDNFDVACESFKTSKP